MRISLKIALRYLFSKKSINIINIIAGISTLGVTIATASLIIILSVFNGLEQIIVSRFNAFNPEIKVSLNEGKFFNVNDSSIQKIQEIDNVKNLSFVLEDFAAIKYSKATQPFPIKGVDQNYLAVCRVDSMLIDGEFKLHNAKGENMAVVGYEVAQQLSIGLGFVSPLILYVPKRSYKVSSDPSHAFNNEYLYPSAIFGIDETADNRVLIPLEMAQELFEAKGQASNIEISLKNTTISKQTQNKIKAILGPKFSVKNRIEQNSFFKILNSERLMIYLILGFVLLIAAFNIVATLTMLIMDKKKDFLSFKSIGLSDLQIKMIFLLNGWITSILGAVLGLILGGLITYIQIKYSIVAFGEGFDLPAYPVDLEILDFVKVFFLVLIIGFLTSLLPTRRFSKNYLDKINS